MAHAATFLFSDIEGSTRRWEERPIAMEAALARHDALVFEAVAAAGGEVFKHTGDGVCAVFAVADAAVSAGVQAQQLLAEEKWGDLGVLKVRMALHTGEASPRGGDYFGPALNRVARLLVAAHGGQVLLTAATASAVSAGQLRPAPPGASARRKGRRRKPRGTRRAPGPPCASSPAPARSPPAATGSGSSMA